MSTQLTSTSLLVTAKQKREKGFTASMLARACGFTTSSNEPDLDTFVCALVDAIRLDNSQNILEHFSIEDRFKPSTLDALLEPKEVRGSKPCHVYLVNSGNYDNTFKIGYTANKSLRLTQIKRDYGVPNAVMVAATYVGSKQSAKKVEEELHMMFQNNRVHTYSGEEWFSLDPAQAKEVENFLTHTRDEDGKN